MSQFVSRLFPLHPKDYANAGAVGARGWAGRGASPSGSRRFYFGSGRGRREGWGRGGESQIKITLSFEDVRCHRIFTPATATLHSPSPDGGGFNFPGPRKVRLCARARAGCGDAGGRGTARELRSAGWGRGPGRSRGGGRAPGSPVPDEEVSVPGEWHRAVPAQGDGLAEVGAQPGHHQLLHGAGDGRALEVQEVAGVRHVHDGSGPGERQPQHGPRLRLLSAPPLAGVAPSPGRSARLRAAGGAGGSAPPPARALPSAPPAFPTTPGARSPPPAPQRAARGVSAAPAVPGRATPGVRTGGIAAAPATAPLIFLFWFESARRRLAKDLLRPPPSSRRPGGTGYPHPPHGLKARFDSSKRVRGAARGPARPAIAAAHSRRQPGASSELRGARQPAQAPPLPVRSVHFLARWYESTPSAAGAAGHGLGPGPGGEPWPPGHPQGHPTPGGGRPGHPAPQALGPRAHNALPAPSALSLSRASCTN